ncbi:energy-coupling factor transporter ATP-binding protein EcfA2 [Arthrobacter sp. CAN_A212]
MLNDEYGPDAWPDYFDRLEASEPPIRALGITDYYSVDTYEEVLRNKTENGRLPNVDLIFPNVEMRYGVGTGKNIPVNFHLIVSPKDADHVAQLRRFLKALTFEAYGENFRCEPDDLMSLGRHHDRTIQDDKTALRAGTNQFKVNFDQLKSEWKKSAWIQKNALIAVAGSNKDGTAGLQEASLATVRKELERFAHIIFASQESQRNFWLGNGAVSIDELSAEWGGPKPCLHGSDAHKLEKVGQPDLDRRTWIKGGLTFEALQQACLEPGSRAFVGATPPMAGFESQTIQHLTVSNAPWMLDSEIQVNPGLVGIIGARGSGKTALADMLAAGGYASPSQLSGRSFLDRARPRLGDASATLSWGGGDTTSRRLGGDSDPTGDRPARVQYLSQHFVEELCSADGVSGELLSEIERVVFQAFPVEDRSGATSFDELLDLRTAGAREIRRQKEIRLRQMTERINADVEKSIQLSKLTRDRTEKAAALTVDHETRAAMLTGEDEDRSQRLKDLNLAEAASAQSVNEMRRTLQALTDLQAEVNDMRQTRLPEIVESLRERHKKADLASEDWDRFGLVFVGDVDSLLVAQISELVERIDAVVGKPSPDDAQTSDASPMPGVLPCIPSEAPMADRTLTSLREEIRHLTDLIGMDDARKQVLERLKDKITRLEAEVAKLDRDIEYATGAPARITAERTARQKCYGEIFEALIAEEQELVALYAPLESRLSSEDGTLGKLSFSVRRLVDQEAWAKQGEDLLDLRKVGPFRGKGALLENVSLELVPAWEAGSSEDVAAAMSIFLANHENALTSHAPVDRDDSDAYLAWEQRVADWLYGSGHIKLSYGVLYDGADVGQLSPGTRGIVLLLLYLSLDQDDLRPLIIDQPEENLDPKSIFTELVDRFRQAKLRRQIILVTHNANLIVNTDADQVIVATSGPHRPGLLPEINYLSGGLDDPAIRYEVCEILEGGETAFQERARRLRVSL